MFEAAWLTLPTKITLDEVDRSKQAYHISYGKSIHMSTVPAWRARGRRLYAKRNEYDVEVSYILLLPAAQSHVTSSATSLPTPSMVCAYRSRPEVQIDRISRTHLRRPRSRSSHSLRVKITLPRETVSPFHVLCRFCVPEVHRGTSQKIGELYLFLSPVRTVVPTSFCTAPVGHEIVSRLSLP